VEIDKDTILSFLRERGEHDKVDQAERELPDRVDTDRDANLLERFGVSPEDLVARMTGGRDIPGL
jgi:hypothetical protein